MVTIIDIAVLEWCKLFADPKDKHFWKSVIADKAFELELYSESGGESYLADYIKSVRKYRDKFLAHLDDDLTYTPPEMELAWITIKRYHKHIVDHEITVHDLRGLPNNLGAFYESQLEDAEAEYTKIARQLSGE